MGPAKKKAVLKHHSEQPFFNIVVGLAPPDHHRCRTLPGQVNQLELKHFRASPEFLCYPVFAEVAMVGGFRNSVSVRHLELIQCLEFCGSKNKKAWRSAFGISPAEYVRTIAGVAKPAWLLSFDLGMQSHPHCLECGAQGCQGLAAPGNALPW